MADYYNLQIIHSHHVDLKERVIFLHSSIDKEHDQDPGVDWRMANFFQKNMYMLDRNPNPITIHQHCIGGEFYPGMMIYDIIKNSASHSNLICHGECMSMGTVILQAADTRISMPNCTFMFHYGSTGGGGNHLDVKNRMLFEDVMSKQMINIYAERCAVGPYFKDKTLAQIKSFLTTKLKGGDWFMAPKEAKHYGFIDHILYEDIQPTEL